ncbi:LLM class flavin-dependent oxidoreductase [Microbacterium sp. CCNWLW134]|uniref:LLM class flavin-dependent oxidoreductase n=1 Tax=Microbacterium sp. CCNWLW134 TaxID=3122064 RepID=UPI00300F8959
MNIDVGVMYPEMPVALGPVIPYADAARGGGHRLWFGQSNIVDSHATMAALIGRGYTIPFGTGVVLHPLWHPHGLGIQALSIARLSGHSYVAGIGPGGTEFQQKALGAPLPRPAAATEEFARRLLSVVPVPLRTHPHSGQPIDPHFGAVEVGFGVLRPGMARASGRSAQWAITWLTPEAYLRDTLIPAAERGADEAGERMPRVAAIVHVGIRRLGRDPDRMAFRAVGAHLTAPHYVDMLKRAGIEVDAADPVAGARRIVRDEVYLYGSATEIVDAAERLGDAGVDEVVFNVFGVSQEHGTGAALHDLSEVLDEVRQRRVRSLLPLPTEARAHTEVTA